MKLVKEVNTLKYQGDIKKLPKCEKCNGEDVEEHRFLTYEHPYKMAEDDEQ